MALFKILKGNSTSLSSQPLVDGYAYFTPDDGRFYIDAAMTSAPDYYIQSSNGIYRIEIESGTFDEIINSTVSKSIGTTAGDMLYWSAADTPARLGIGSTGSVLTTSANGIPT